MTKPMMQCGHTANATSDGQPVCVICVGIKPGARLVDDSPPDLTGRVARCSDCGTERASNPQNMPFFQHVPAGEKDRFYCGCRGFN